MAIDLVSGNYDLVGVQVLLLRCLPLLLQLALRDALLKKRKRMK